MLEGLDAIDWTSLEHAYGDASDVPDLLRDLAEGQERAFALPTKKSDFAGWLGR